MRSEAGDALAVEEPVARARREGSGEQVDERRLARAVGTYERMARAAPNLEAHPVHRRERAETPGEPLGAKRRAHRRPRRDSIAPRMPPRAKKTNTTSARPSQNCQYTGLIPAR